MRFNKEFDFNNSKNIKSFRVVTSFSLLEPYYTFVEVTLGEDINFFYTRARIIGYLKDQNLSNLIKEKTSFFADTRYKKDISFDKFFDMLKHNKELLNDTLDTLEYLIVKHIDLIKGENKLWEK